jgi:hypothetical protein
VDVSLVSAKRDGNPGSWEKPGEQLKPGKREDVEKNILKIGVM